MNEEEPLTMYELICKEAEERQKLEKKLNKIKQNVSILDLIVSTAIIIGIIANIINSIIFIIKGV